MKVMETPVVLIFPAGLAQHSWKGLGVFHTHHLYLVSFSLGLLLANKLLTKLKVPSHNNPH